MPECLQRTGAALAAVLTLAGALIAGARPVRADPPQDVVAADASRIVQTRFESDRQSELEVYSAAMNSTTRIRLLRAADPDEPAPTFYLLNGADGGADKNWLEGTDLVDFFRDKQVNVVIPFGGAGSYFTDWRSDDPVLGRQRWSTFLTKELPPLVDATFNGSGANAIAGISMGGTSVFQLAMAAPGLYRAIGSYSGCVRTSDPAGQAMVQAVVTQQRGNVVNMWGPPSDPAWRANDPYLHADRLRGLAIYVATGTGQPGSMDTLDGVHGDISHLLYQLLFGAPLEAVANLCTHQLQDRLRRLGVAATFDFRPNGTHSWGYWQQDLHNSWPTIEAAIR
ncbi:alpha/beta hydrolase family protein [Nocardia gamkensis]|uniref:alpha/beta hydrolase n=1 Tax=Nocardia gamkensis TaxID=352869 RepID=UPI0033C9985F